MNILDELHNDHGSDIQQHLMEQLGLNQQQAAAALQKVGPLILGALKKQKDTHGEDHVQGQLQQFGSVDMTNIGAVLGGAQGGDADLGGLLGGQGHQASQMLANHLSIFPARR